MMMRAILTLMVAILLVMESHGQGKRVTIAMAQIFSLDGDRSGNFVRIANAAKEAKSRGADIVTFPESCILGWINADAHKRATTIPGTDSDKLCEIARQNKIYICVGLDEKDGDNLYGAVLLIDDNGKILYKHRKINVLPELMTPPYSVGEKVGGVQTRFGKIGLMICADSFQDDVLSRMKEAKPDLLLIPYGWAEEEAKWPEHGKELEKVVQRAATTVGCAVVGTDLVGEISGGPWKGRIYGGQSVAADKSGKVIARGTDRDSDLVVVSVTIP